MKPSYHILLECISLEYLNSKIYFRNFHSQYLVNNFLNLRRTFFIFIIDSFLIFSNDNFIIFSVGILETFSSILRIFPRIWVSWKFSRTFQFRPSPQIALHKLDIPTIKDSGKKFLHPDIILLQDMTILFLFIYILGFFVDFLLIINSLKSFLFSKTSSMSFLKLLN